MKGFTHLAAGALAGYALFSGSSPKTMLLTCGVSAIGSLLPDIDIGSSKIAGICRPAAFGIQLIFGHRGVFHSLLLWGGLAATWYILAPNHLPWILAAGCGIGSHLLLDTLNPTGVPLLWPLSKRISLAKSRSGGLMDFLLGLLLTALFLYLFIPTVLARLGQW